MSPARRTGGPRGGGIHPLAVSLITIAAVLCVVFYAFNQGLPFVHQFTVHAVVNNSVNVRADAPVRIAGIDVGTVTGISPSGRASVITFTLKDDALPLHTDATLRIRDRLFLEGAYYLDLDPGSPSAPTVSDGFTIPEPQTTTPVQFFQFLSVFNAQARSSLRRSLDTINQGFSPRPGAAAGDSGAGAFKQAIPQLTPVLKDAAWVTRALRGTRPGDIETLLSGAGQVAGTLAASERQLTGLVGDLNRTSGALAASDGALGQSVAQLDRTVREAPGELVRIDRALPPVTALAAALDPSLKVAPPLLDRISAAVAELARIVAPGARERLLTTVRATFVEFPGILTLLAKAFPVTKPATDCLRTHITPILNQTVPDGKLSTGLPVWQDFVHFLPTVAGASGDFDANGPFVRVLAGAGSNTLSGGVLGTTPLGQLVGSGPPGGGSLVGVRPSWVGPLTAADFRPDVPCTSQRLPSLAAPAAAADLGSRRSAAPSPRTVHSLAARLARRGRGMNR